MFPILKGRRFIQSKEKPEYNYELKTILQA